MAGTFFCVPNQTKPTECQPGRQELRHSAGVVVHGMPIRDAHRLEPRGAVLGAGHGEVAVGEDADEVRLRAARGGEDPLVAAALEARAVRDGAHEDLRPGKRKGVEVGARGVTDPSIDPSIRTIHPS